MDTLTIIITGGILLIAIVIAFILANRRDWRILKSSPAGEESDDSDSSNAVDHYTEMRDELTLEDAEVDDEEDEEVEDDDETSSGFSFTGIAVSLIGISVVFMVGFMVLNAVKSAIPPEQMNATIAGFGGNTMGNMFSIIPILMVIIAVIFIIMTVFGISGGTTADDTPPKNKRKKGVKHYTAMRDKLSEK